MLLVDLSHRQGWSIRTLSSALLSGVLPPETWGVLTVDASRFDFCGGITAALKRAIELPPWAEDHSVGGVIDGDSTWWATRWLEADFDR